MADQDNTAPSTSNPVSGSTEGGGNLFSQLAAVAAPAIEKYGPGLVAQFAGNKDDDAVTTTTTAAAEGPAEPATTSNVSATPSAPPAPVETAAPSAASAEDSTGNQGFTETVKEHGIEFLTSQMEHLLPSADAEGSTSDAPSGPAASDATPPTPTDVAASSPVPASAGATGPAAAGKPEEKGEAPKK